MSVTIIIPISREERLEDLFNNLNELDTNGIPTNLLAIVDGSINFFLKVRGKVQSSKFDERLTIHLPQKKKPDKFNIDLRREKIAQIHNEAKAYLQNCQYVMGIEDDTIVPPDALRKLYKHMQDHEFTGIVSGIQMGRWGVPYIGAWEFDDIEVPYKIHSAIIQSDKQLVDATGFYCFMTERRHYEYHLFENCSVSNLGPDVNFGIKLRQEGLLNYIDTTIKCGHYDDKTNKVIDFNNTEPKQVFLEKRNHNWKQII